MGFSWVGAKQFVDEKREENLIAEERSQKRKDMIFQTMLPELIKRRTTVSQTSGKLASLGNRLKGYGLEEDSVNRIIETGDVESIEAFTKDLGKGYEEAEKAGRGNQYLETVRTTLDNAMYKPAQEAKTDLSGLGPLMESVADEFSFADEMTTTVPGAFSYTPPVYTESRDVSDYGKLEERLAENSRQKAQNEKREVDKLLSAINRRLESSNLSEDDERKLREDQSVLLERSQTVGSALDAFKGDEKDAFPLLTLYGTDSVGEMVENFPTYDVSKLQPSFRENISKAPFAVVSELQVERLLGAGILKPGDVILLNGEIQEIKPEV